MLLLPVEMCLVFGRTCRIGVDFGVTAVKSWLPPQIGSLLGSNADKTQALWDPQNLRLKNGAPSHRRDPTHPRSPEHHGSAVARRLLASAVRTHEIWPSTVTLWESFGCQSTPCARCHDQWWSDDWPAYRCQEANESAPLIVSTTKTSGPPRGPRAGAKLQLCWNKLICWWFPVSHQVKSVENSSDAPLAFWKKMETVWWCHGILKGEKGELTA